MPPPGAGGAQVVAPSPRTGTSVPTRPARGEGIPQKQRKLLEEYAVGATLGEGAFGVVRICQHRATGKDYAVKMVDKVETPVPAIMREAEMLRTLEHPNIVKFKDVFVERCFVCIVMEIYKGGDLVDGLQRGGPFPSDKIIHVAHQLAASLHHLHTNSVAHRDVKGDNYMMDRQDLLDPSCVVVLTDFGTAAHYKPSEPFSTQCGTRQFWAPELLDKAYGLKVDIWALGVLMYGLVTGRFPFRDENDIRKKEVKIRTRVGEDCQDYVLRMLEKLEAKRPDSFAVMSHPYLSSMANMIATNSIQGNNGDGEGAGAKIEREDGANAGIKDRRHELVERLQQEHQRPPAARKLGQIDARPFVVESKLRPGVRLTYEWYEPAKMKASSLLDVVGAATPAAAELFRDVKDLSIFNKMLQEHGIDTSAFGRANCKSLANLAAEVRTGEARLMLDATAHKKLVRVIDVLVLRLYDSESRTHFIVETATGNDEGVRYENCRMPGMIKAPHENARQSAERLLATFDLCLDQVKLDLDSTTRTEEEYESASYPGLLTFYNREVVNGVIDPSKMSQETLQRIGLPERSMFKSRDRRWSNKENNWMTQEEALARHVQYGEVKNEANSSALVAAPIGMSAADLEARLASAGIDVSRFGCDGMRTLKEFSQELYRGEAFLSEDSAGQLVRTVNVVIIILTDTKTGNILVQTKQTNAKGDTLENVRLPGNKCRPDENHFICARRIVQRELEIDDADVQFNETVQFVEEQQTSTNYPGIKTIYRKFLIFAQL